MSSPDIVPRVKHLAGLSDDEVNILRIAGIQNEEDLSYAEFEDFDVTISLVKRRKLNLISRYLKLGTFSLDAMKSMEEIKNVVHRYIQSVPVLVEDGNDDVSHDFKSFRNSNSHHDVSAILKTELEGFSRKLDDLTMKVNGLQNQVSSVSSKSSMSSASMISSGFSIGDQVAVRSSAKNQPHVKGFISDINTVWAYVKDVSWVFVKISSSSVQFNKRSFTIGDHVDITNYDVNQSTMKGVISDTKPGWLFVRLMN